MNAYLRHYLRRAAPPTPDGLPTLREITREYVDYLLSLCADDRAEVSRILAVAPEALEKGRRRGRAA